MNRDPLQLLAEARPADLDPTARTRAEVRDAELTAAMAVPRTAPDRRGVAARGRRPIRPAWGWGLGLASAAAATAVAVSVSGTTPLGPDLATPTQGRQIQLSASEVLVGAAAEADRRPDTVGRYWHPVSRIFQYYPVMGKISYTVVDRSVQQEWVSFDPGGVRIGRQRNLGARPATPTDEQAWKRAGSPSTFTVQVEGAVHRTLSTKAYTPATTRPIKKAGKHVYWVGRNVSMRQLRALPADPVRLKALLMKDYAGHGTESTSTKTSADAWLFAVATGLVLDMPVTPKVRAGAFRMLAKLPGVTSVGAVRDAEGRPGTGVGVTEATKLGGTQRYLLIIDPATGTALGYQQVVVKPGGNTAGFRPNSTISARTQTLGWTDTAPN